MKKAKINKFFNTYLGSSDIAGIATNVVVDFNINIENLISRNPKWAKLIDLYLESYFGEGEKLLPNIERLTAFYKVYNFVKEELNTKCIENAFKEFARHCLVLYFVR